LALCAWRLRPRGRLQRSGMGGSRCGNEAHVAGGAWGGRTGRTAATNGRAGGGRGARRAREGEREREMVARGGSTA